MEPKYKVGDFLQFYYHDGTVGTLHVDFIECGTEYEYCEGCEQCCSTIRESDVIRVIPHDDEEYQLYLKLKEKYG